MYLANQVKRICLGKKVGRANAENVGKLKTDTRGFSAGSLESILAPVPTFDRGDPLKKPGLGLFKGGLKYKLREDGIEL